MKMNRKIRNSWTKALRSGKYSQARGRLKDHDRHCCLGVLCELAIKVGVIKRIRPDQEFLPRSVVKWAGLSGTNPEINVTRAASLNDRLRYSFERIADEIEAHL